MNHIRTTATVALLIAGLIGTAAAPASATSVIGFGNAAYGNSCTNQGSATTQGATTGGPGAATGLAVAIPGSNPTNQCGDLGLNSNTIGVYL